MQSVRLVVLTGTIPGAPLGWWYWDREPKWDRMIQNKHLSFQKYKINKIHKFPKLIFLLFSACRLCCGSGSGSGVGRGSGSGRVLPLLAPGLSTLPPPDPHCGSAVVLRSAALFQKGAIASETRDQSRPRAAAHVQYCRASCYIPTTAMPNKQGLFQRGNIFKSFDVNVASTHPNFSPSHKRFTEN